MNVDYSRDSLLMRVFHKFHFRVEDVVVAEIGKLCRWILPTEIDEILFLLVELVAGLYFREGPVTNRVELGDFRFELVEVDGVTHPEG